jgi:hypothetical protein
VLVLVLDRGGGLRVQVGDGVSCGVWCDNGTLYRVDTIGFLCLLLPILLMC